jgi:phosphoglycerate dehydrogenase-like enzyme
MVDSASGLPDLHILSTKFFDSIWLDRLRAVAPGLRVTQITTDDAADVPREIWASVDVLYAWKALPDPDWAPRLRWIQLDTAGYDHVLATPYADGRIPVTNLAGVAPPNMAEHAFLMMLAFGHHLPDMLVQQRARNWPTPGYRWERFTPSELLGATVGVVGYGAIGRQIGRIAHAFGMRVLALAPSRASLAQKPLVYQVPQLVGLAGSEPDAFYRPDQLLDMLPQCDYVVLVLPHTPASHHLFGVPAFAAMKPGAVLVNIARGGVVDETALIDALRSGHLGGAALDVFEQEPLPADSPLWEMPNVIVSPHIAGLTSRYAEVVFDLFSTNLRRFLAGEFLLNQVLPSRTVAADVLENTR